VHSIMQAMIAPFHAIGFQARQHEGLAKVVFSIAPLKWTAQTAMELSPSGSDYAIKLTVLAAPCSPGE
jgi:hypothetical protein